MTQLRILLIAGLCVLVLGGTVATAYAQHTTPSVDGVIESNEYGDHTDGQNAKISGGQTWYVTWDDTNLYVALTNANLSEGAILYIDHNPIAPANGGTNANGNLGGSALRRHELHQTALPRRFRRLLQRRLLANTARPMAPEAGEAPPPVSAAMHRLALATCASSASRGQPSRAAAGQRPSTSSPTPRQAAALSTARYQQRTRAAASARAQPIANTTKCSNTANGASTKPFSINSSDASVGVAPYATLKAAFDAINAGTLKANVNLYVVNNTTETATATLNASGSGSASYSSVLIQPTGGSFTIAGAIAGPLIDLNGADNVTMDGLNAGGNALTLSNSNIQRQRSHRPLHQRCHRQRHPELHDRRLGRWLHQRGRPLQRRHSGTTGNDNNTISDQRYQACRRQSAALCDLRLPAPWQGEQRHCHLRQYHPRFL